MTASVRGQHRRFAVSTRHVRGMLFGIVLVAAVIAGLLAMHTLHVHGGAVEGAQPVDAASVAHAEIDRPGIANPVSAHEHVQLEPQADGPAACADCGNSGTALTMLCLFIVLTLLVAVAMPRSHRGTGRPPAGPLRASPRIQPQTTRGLSLQELCISRT